MFCHLYDCVPYVLLIQFYGCQNYDLISVDRYLAFSLTTLLPTTEQNIFQDFCFGGVTDKLGYKISGRRDWS